PRMRAGREGDGPPLFVVATQCVEAGADLDFDALISQVSPLDCLRQRFGRLDRLGRRAARGLENRGLILAAADETKTGFADQIYGPAVAHTWAWLQEESRGGEVLMDFGVDALCLPKDAPRLLASRVRAPILLPAYLDAWASTSPAPAADPDVATFLHGPEAGPGDVEVVWRADLAEDDLGDSALAAALVGVIPPSSLEAVAVPVFVARAWLQHRSVQVAD